MELPDLFFQRLDAFLQASDGVSIRHGSHPHLQQGFVGDPPARLFFVRV
jgi:hypothetical protein